MIGLRTTDAGIGVMTTERIESAAVVLIILNNKFMKISHPRNTFSVSQRSFRHPLNFILCVKIVVAVEAVVVVVVVIVMVMKIIEPDAMLVLL